MKIRSGFVSNSSSSSFIVANDGEELKASITVDLSSLVRETITTEDELKQYFVNEYGGRYDDIASVLDDNDWLLERYTKARTAIRQGKKVFIGRVSSDDYDNPWSYLLYNEGFASLENKNFTVIMDGD